MRKKLKIRKLIRTSENNRKGINNNLCNKNESDKEIINESI